MLTKIALLALAGALGTLSRFGLAGLVYRLAGIGFPWGTLAVNVTGCFIAGLLFVLFETRWPVASQTRLIVLVGFFGAFTTFSAFMVETADLLRSSQWLYAAANVSLQNTLGLVAVLAGAAIGRFVL
ncbi:MAG: CrcB family protein [Desulfatibacillaceae bacterium]|nr:CrcB family protein [Desulfatibacillaceae bacterium]